MWKAFNKDGAGEVFDGVTDFSEESFIEAEFRELDGVLLHSVTHLEGWEGGEDVKSFGSSLLSHFVQEEFFLEVLFLLNVFVLLQKLLVSVTKDLQRPCPLLDAGTCAGFIILDDSFPGGGFEVELLFEEQSDDLLGQILSNLDTGDVFEQVHQGEVKEDLVVLQSKEEVRFEHKNFGIVEKPWRSLDEAGLSSGRTDVTLLESSDGVLVDFLDFFNLLAFH